MHLVINDVLHRWVNPYYLRPDVIGDVREAVLARPHVKYAVLDGFFREEQLDELARRHAHLQFSEEQDRRAKDGAWLPYDGAVCFANRQHFGSELFFDACWHAYCAYLVGLQVRKPVSTEVKLRYHRPHADGFWIHTDSSIRSMVAIAYFNREWTAADGGLLQLWMPDPADHPGTFTIEAPSGRMDFLTQHKRIRTGSPGGGFPDGRPHDLILLDQIVPVYNRVFLCNFRDEPAYHSVTPSNGRERLGFVQWLTDNKATP